MKNSIIAGVMVASLAMLGCPRASMEEQIVDCELDRKESLDLCKRFDEVLDEVQIKACQARAEADYAVCLSDVK